MKILNSILGYFNLNLWLLFHYVKASYTAAYKKYYMRTSNSKGLWVGPGRSKSKAISRLKSGLDTWSIGSSNALSIAKGASPTGRYRFDSAHTAGKGKRTFAHYHPHEYGTHSFYGGGKLW